MAMVWRYGAFLFCCFVVLLQSSAGNAQGMLRSKHGEWQVRCSTIGTPARENCSVVQSVVAPKYDNAGMTIIVLRTTDKQAYLLRVVAPRGISREFGVGVALDGKTLGKQKVVNGFI